MPARVLRVQHHVYRQVAAREARDVEPMLVKGWASVVDGGPAFNQHWLNVSCLL